MLTQSQAEMAREAVRRAKRYAGYDESSGGEHRGCTYVDENNEPVCVVAQLLLLMGVWEEVLPVLKRNNSCIIGAMSFGDAGPGGPRSAMAAWFKEWPQGFAAELQEIWDARDHITAIPRPEGAENARAALRALIDQYLQPVATAG